MCCSTQAHRFVCQHALVTLPLLQTGKLCLQTSSFAVCLSVPACNPLRIALLLRQSVHNAGVSGMQNRTVATKLHSRSSEEDAAKNPTVKVASTSTSRASPGANGASPGSSRAGEEKPATVTITLSADSAQRLKAQAAESGLHQSDSGLASKLVLGCSQRNLTENCILYVL